MTNNEIKDLVKNTNFFSNETTLNSSMNMSEDELISIFINEINRLDNKDRNRFINDFLKVYKQELLHQDKTTLRNVIQEIRKEDIGYVTGHLHPRGNFITEFDDGMAMFISTINELNVENYQSKDKMLADIILKRCFSIKYDTKNNEVMINAITPSVRRTFSKDILSYIKNHIDIITKEILDSNILLTYKNQNNYDLFKEYMQIAVADIFSQDNLEMPKDIKVGDKIQTKYCDMATVIEINAEDKTLKLDRDIQNEITVFTDTISYENEHIITNILSPDSEIDEEMEVE